MSFLRAAGMTALAAGFIAVLTIGPSEGADVAVHALAMHGEPKYAAGFDHFDYVNPNAPKGGEMKLATEGTFDGYKPLTDEAVINAKPDVVMVMTRPGAGSTDEEVLAHPAIAVTPAGKNKAVLRMNSLHLLGFGPRTASAVSNLNKELYGKPGNVSQ